MRTAMYCLLSLWLFTGCVSSQLAQEKLAIMVLTYPDTRAERTVYLPNDYGFLIKWKDLDPPEFYLYDKSSRRTRYTTDFSAFLAGLKEFPSDAKVDWIRGCTGGFAWAMPEAERGQLQEVIKAKGFRLTDADDGNFIICTCETKEVRLLKTADQRTQRTDRR